MNRIRPIRAKVRPGRLKGKALEQLRRDCFERDLYRCQAEIPGFADVCGNRVTWESGHMAHIGAKRRHGDSLDNVQTLCGTCHGLEHQYGKSFQKPCPPKGNSVNG
jgi:5-methylcytosine-specific restriction endonuclease McrA